MNLYQQVRSSSHSLLNSTRSQIKLSLTSPTELKHSIIKLLPDIKDVRSLVHASPSLHDAYLSLRLRLLTQLALNHLHEKAVDLRPAPLIQMRFNGKHVGRMNAFTLFPAIRSAVQALHNRSTTAKAPLELNADECFTLLCLEEIVRWDLVPNDDESIRDNLLNRKEPRRAQPMSGSKYWRNNEDRFYVLYLEEDGFYPPDVADMKKQLLIEHWYLHDASGSGSY